MTANQKFNIARLAHTSVEFASELPPSLFQALYLDACPEIHAERDLPAALDEKMHNIAQEFDESNFPCNFGNTEVSQLLNDPRNASPEEYRNAAMAHESDGRYW